MDASSLVARVADVYARSDPPSWPNPHADREASEEEYSRVTDPGRYTAVLLRARAWVEVLSGLPDVETSRDGSGVRLVSARPDTQPLVVVEESPDGGVPSVRVGLADAVNADLFPDCGCDACDFGSADLLEGLDSAVLELLGGAVLLVGDDWQGLWTTDGGGSVSGGARTPELEQVMAWGERAYAGDVAAAPEGVRVLVNRAWAR